MNTYQLAEKLGVRDCTISAIQLGKIYKNAGGKIRQAKPQVPRIPDEIRAKIRVRYKKGVRGCGSHALAKEFGYSQTTILKIVNEKK
ncbi:MAG: hypothetical protein IJK81_03175 [Selenomonadaceae bacterium]|nr:hypothetical protein [Selenomonadaceae bacterium]